MDNKINKVEPKSKQCVFIGHAIDYKDYRCLNPVTNILYTSRHVLFHEHIFPYRTLVGSKSYVPYMSPSILIVD